MMLLHEFTLVSSTIAIVSSTTSYAAAIFILFFALATYRVHKRHVQLTAAFVFSQLIAFISVLVASLLCLLDPVYQHNQKLPSAEATFSASHSGLGAKEQE
ncbi:hypothetical protein scyTo_0022978, partial [Scyliorhinus torazame]|nr:hypothetical protein [Scyliorhinus torazame]